MKTRYVVLFVLLALAILASPLLAQVPNPNSANATCQGITVTAFQQGTSNTFSYAISVANGATATPTNESGQVVAVREVFAIALYPANQITPTQTANLPWQVFPGANPQGFGFQVIPSLPPLTGVLPGQNFTVGTASFSAAPGAQQVLIILRGVNQNNPGQGNQRELRCLANVVVSGGTPPPPPPPVIPEPGTMMLLGLGLAPLARLLKRK